jgi:hypothetical protein
MYLDLMYYTAGIVHKLSPYSPVPGTQRTKCNARVISEINFSERRGSAVGIATGYVLDDRRGQTSSPGRGEDVHFSISSRLALGPTQTPNKWVPGLKRQGREADHTLETSAEVKKTWIYTSIPAIRLHGAVLS